MNKLQQSFEFPEIQTNIRPEYAMDQYFPQLGFQNSDTLNLGKNSNL